MLRIFLNKYLKTITHNLLLNVKYELRAKNFVQKAHLRFSVILELLEYKILEKFNFNRYKYSKK
jgi:hypothetical protein